MSYNLFQAMNGAARTANGGVTNHSSLNPCVDFFFAAGSSRGKDISQLFVQAIIHDRDIALRTLLWLRDVRGGAGERQQFKNLLVKGLNTLYENDKESYNNFLNLIPVVGRFDDLLVLMGTKHEAAACKVWTSAILAGNGLAAKWAPRKDKKGAKPLRKFLNMTEHAWRKLVVSRTDVVETKMCNREWDNINFNHVPSQAMTKYMTAFHRNSQTFAEWREALKRGDKNVKVNAGAVYPYDIVRKLPVGGHIGWNPSKKHDDVLQKMWESQPDYLNGNKERMLPVIDVSGSMQSRVPQQEATCMDVAISLGIYIAERNEGIFKNQCMSFSESPRMYQLSGTLADKVNQIQARENVGYSTDVVKVFTTLLEQAIQYNVPRDQMPTKLFIVSDMEFNAGFNGGFPLTAYQHIKKVYGDYGYDMPDIIFWRVNTLVQGNVPVTITDTGTALVSGFSPSILTALMGGQLTPENVMMEAIGNPRYDF
ncbi:protein of unknown function DUF2828 [Vibrio phage BUCT194]|uniref:DUF2828 family protein n=1 Tax=Vibrio phage BUCT194 TaxID=2859072 RepID=A0AAE9BP63_9CAUD|nr:protein of unknown function DUF2828 [Vibrio phage BUCT194]UAW01120.1 protein of unknown function DUF2828 [Vibrio phage BUCT194]